MQTRIQKWGNSFGVRIPVKLAKEMHLWAGSAVNLEVQENKLIIHAPKYDLKEMLDAIDSQNMHGQLLDDMQVGNEEW